MHVCLLCKIYPKTYNTFPKNSTCNLKFKGIQFEWVLTLVKTRDFFQ